MPKNIVFTAVVLFGLVHSWPIKCHHFIVVLVFPSLAGAYVNRLSYSEFFFLSLCTVQDFTVWEHDRIERTFGLRTSLYIF